MPSVQPEIAESDRSALSSWRRHVRDGGYLTGDRPIIEYLLAPLFRYRDESLRER